MSNLENILLIKTVQSQSIKILVESLKEVLTDINVYFDSNGMKIMTMDNARVALVYVRLVRENFEEYFCENKVICGLNMIYLFKLIKTLNNNDVITMFIRKSQPNELGIRIENKEKKAERRKKAYSIKKLKSNEIVYASEKV